MRSVWIVKKKPELTKKDFTDAELNGCPEIANGIPPALANTVSEADLPLKYVELYHEPMPPRELDKEIDDIVSRLVKLEGKK